MSTIDHSRSSSHDAPSRPARPLRPSLWLLCSLAFGLLVAGGCSREPAPEPSVAPQEETSMPAESAGGAPEDAENPAQPQRTESHSEMATPPPVATEPLDEAVPPTDAEASPDRGPAPDGEAAPDAEAAQDADGSPDPAEGAATDARPLEAPDRTDPSDVIEADSPPPAPGSGQSPAEIAAKAAFEAPEGGRQLSPDARLWVDLQRGRLVVDGYVTLREGPLEMFACPVGTKEHESIVSVLSMARYVHAGLLAIGAMPGTPVSFVPEYRPATGQRIAIWVMWRDADGEIQKVPAQQWVQQTGTDQELAADWVFAGSSFWRDPETGREYYQADSGDLVCVSNFSTATLDLPVESTQSNAALQYSAFTERIPPRETPVRLVFVPIPLPSDEPEPAEEQKADPATPPEDALLSEPA